MPTGIQQTVRTTAPDANDIYFAWLKSGHVYGIHHTNNEKNTRAVSTDQLVTILHNAKTVTKVPRTDTPFSEWEFPVKALQIGIHSHTDAYALTVTPTDVLTVYGDQSLPHGVTTPRELRKTVKENPVSQVLIEETPFKRNVRAGIGIE